MYMATLMDALYDCAKNMEEIQRVKNRDERLEAIRYSKMLDEQKSNNPIVININITITPKA